MLTKEHVKRWATEAGFSRCGIAPAHILSKEQADFECAVAKSYHAGMHFLERDIETRFNPARLLPNCQSVIVVTLNYLIDRQPGSSYKTARYTWIDDYHVIVKDKLATVARKMQEMLPDLHYRVTVDSSSISEKNWAVAAGIGCIGKNSLLHNEDGTFFVIGTLLTDYSFPQYDISSESDCGNCRICMDKCPTKAIKIPYQIDARLCYAYQTIENKNPEFQTLKSSPYLFGCDICQEVCPKNKKKSYNETMVTKSSLFLHLQNQGYENLDEAEFKYYFGKSAIARRTYKRFIRAVKAQQTDYQEGVTSI